MFSYPLYILYINFHLDLIRYMFYVIIKLSTLCLNVFLFNICFNSYMYIHSICTFKTIKPFYTVL